MLKTEMGSVVGYLPGGTTSHAQSGADGQITISPSVVTPASLVVPPDLEMATWFSVLPGSAIVRQLELVLTGLRYLMALVRLCRPTTLSPLIAICLTAAPPLDENEHDGGLGQ